jgi:hypothetical protein
MPARFLLLESDPFDPRLASFLIHGETCIVGRARDSNFIVEDCAVSQHHAKIIWSSDDQAYWLIDLNSANGTFHNENRVARAKLAMDDTLMFGSRRFRIRPWLREESPDRTQALPRACRPALRPAKWLMPAALLFLALTLCGLILRPVFFHETKAPASSRATPPPRMSINCRWEYVADAQTFDDLKLCPDADARVKYLAERLGKSLRENPRPTRGKAEGCYEQAMLCRELLLHDLPLQIKANIVWIHNDRCKLFEEAVEYLAGSWKAADREKKQELRRNAAALVPEYVWNDQTIAGERKGAAGEDAPSDAQSAERPRRENVACLRLLHEVLNIKLPVAPEGAAP